MKPIGLQSNTNWETKARSADAVDVNQTPATSSTACMQLPYLHPVTNAESNDTNIEIWKASNLVKWSQLVERDRLTRRLLEYYNSRKRGHNPDGFVYTSRTRTRALAVGGLENTQRRWPPVHYYIERLDLLNACLICVVTAWPNRASDQLINATYLLRSGD